MNPSIARQHAADPVWHLDAINATLQSASPRTIMLWALAQGLPAIVSTSFGEESAAMLHLATRVAPEVPVVWVDTGFVSAETRAFAETMQQRLSLNLHVYRPTRPAISVLHELGVQDPLDLSPEARQRLADEVKLAPFQRALEALQPKLWVSGIRAEETALRATLAPVTLDPRGILKIAPFFAATTDDMARYLGDHALPRNLGYVDPTKSAPHLECGLHGRGAPAAR